MKLKVPYYKNKKSFRKVKLNLEINVYEPNWYYAIDKLENFLKKVATQITYLEKYIISIVLGNDQLISQINKEYRGKNTPTNVLSFPIHDSFTNQLGEVILSFETIYKEAKEKSIDIKAHTAHMLLHGILHLLNYDHKTEEQALIMEQKEAALLKQLGFSNPYH